MIRCVIIDDEYLARERLKKLLSNHPEVEIVGEAKNGTAGIELIRQQLPKLVFLDIQMPDLDGFGVIEQLNEIPYIIFTTAYDQYALKAFEIHALDYLLKPFDEIRLNDAIQLVLDRKAADESRSLANQMKSLFQSFENTDGKYRNSFLIKERGFETEIKTNDIIYVEAQGNYAKLVTTGKEYLYRIAMNILETELDPTYFLRIHRAYILNKNWMNC